MIYLIQFLRMLSKKEQTYFLGLFDDFTEVVEECNYQGHESELVNEMLLNHLGYTFEDKRQLELVTKCVMDKQKYKSLKGLFQ